ncbi:uroporphyrinogen decarboxylase/cobalamine-independent methonine synthase family protein [Flavimobilis rhizosphaerae]|uniref:hypothetical protein n=1 Tax=Flavimobilis rhizosphaerae TaxID=2775421 RepID=UPI002E2B19D6|nr:hypothetical protein [Flavimobilis rhizosphaerae]
MRALATLPVLAARGPGSDRVGRTASLLDGMPVELGPHGWRLADHAGVDLERARAAHREDLDALAVAAVGWAGEIVVEAVGPWSLAASLWLARGDRVLCDDGAVADLGAALAEALTRRVHDVRRQAPGAHVTVLLAEPLVGQVVAGVLPTFSGHARLRAVPRPRVLEVLSPVVAAVRAADARVVVHVGTAVGGVAPAVLAGADGVGLDAGPWDERRWETIATAVERGVELWQGLPPARVSSCAGPDLVALARLVAEPWRRVGLPAADLARVVLHEALGEVRVDPAPPAQRSVDEARAAGRNLRRTALLLAERAAG